MTTYRIKGPELHPVQRAIRACPARFIVVAGGRRLGKTRLGIERCVKIALEGGRGWWVAPTYKVGAVGWRILLKLIRNMQDQTRVRLGERMVTFPSGGTVQIRSAENPASLRSEGLDYLVVDEVAHMARWDEVWTQALRPTLTDRKGQALFISTPAGFNHFYELFKRAENGNQNGAWASFQFPTSANPFIDPQEIEDARLDLPRLVFRQEYGAEFVQLAGALFRREWFGIIDELPACSYVRYWDLAVSTKQQADYTVGAKCGLHDGTLVIADVVRGRWEWPDAVKTIGNTARMDGTAVIQGIEDVGVQKGMYQTLVREPALAGLTFSPVSVNKDKLVRCNPWLARAEQGKVALVRGAWNAAFLDEVCAFPETQHDDQVDAVSGAMQLIGGGLWWIS